MSNSFRYKNRLSKLVSLTTRFKDKNIIIGTIDHKIEYIIIWSTIIVYYKVEKKIKCHDVFELDDIPIGFEENNPSHYSSGIRPTILNLHLVEK